MSDIEGKAARVAASERGQRASFKTICGIERKISLLVSYGCFLSSQKRQKLRCSGNSCFDQERRSERIIARHVELVASRNGASGRRATWTEKPRQGSGSESGDERINSSRNAAIACVKLMKQLTGLTCLLTLGISTADKLAPLRREADELTAIFVTILKRAKE